MPKQEAAARHSMKKEGRVESRKFKRPIVTRIVPVAEFYRAEQYHLHYFEKRGLKPTCHLSDAL